MNKNLCQIVSCLGTVVAVVLAIVILIKVNKNRGEGYVDRTQLELPLACLCKDSVDLDKLGWDKNVCQSWLASDKDNFYCGAGGDGYNKMNKYDLGSSCPIGAPVALEKSQCDGQTCTSYPEPGYGGCPKSGSKK